MVNPNELFRAWLLTLPLGLPQRDDTGSVYTVNLPEYWDPKDGPGLVIGVRGGNAHAEILGLIKPSFQVRVWAGPNEQDVAWKVYGKIFDSCHGVCNVNLNADGFILSCLETVTGQDVTDPDSGYATVIGFFDLQMRSN